MPSSVVRRYDPATDTFLDELQLDRAEVSAGIRQRALLAAIEAAKLGLAHDIYATAGRYARWLATGEAELSPQGSFQTRLQDLVDECKRSGEVDDDYVIHIMQVVMGIWPEPVAANIDALVESLKPDSTIRHTHSNIKDGP